MIQIGTRPNHDGCAFFQWLIEHVSINVGTALITSNKLQDLRIDYPERFEEIARLTEITSNTLQVYCSDQEKFKRWKDNNKDKMEEVRAILDKSPTRNGDAG